MFESDHEFSSKSTAESECQSVSEASAWELCAFVHDSVDGKELCRRVPGHNAHIHLSSQHMLGFRMEFPEHLRAGDD